MASSVHCGQAALVGLPNIKESKHNNHRERETSLANVALSRHLCVDRKRLKSDDTTGIGVYKISKVRNLKEVAMPGITNLSVVVVVA